MLPARRAEFAVVISAIALVVSVVALVFALRPAATPPVVERFVRAAEAAEDNAHRIKSATQMRGLTIAVLAWAAAHDGEAPPAARWAQSLLEAQLVTEEMLTPPGGAEVAEPYRYIRPTAEQIGAARDGGDADVVVFYEDPTLWGGAGGTVVTLDTGTRWVEGGAYAEFVGGLPARE